MIKILKLSATKDRESPNTLELNKFMLNPTDFFQVDLDYTLPYRIQHVILLHALPSDRHRLSVFWKSRLRMLLQMSGDKKR